MDNCFTLEEVLKSGTDWETIYNWYLTGRVDLIYEIGGERVWVSIP